MTYCTWVDISGGALGMLSDQQIKQDKKNKNLTVEDKPSTDCSLRDGYG
jgi:hypothetical protein